MTLGAVCSLASSLTAQAFDIYPEFHSLTESESSSVDSTELIDSEYQSDFVTYLTPLRWDADRYGSNSKTGRHSFDTTVGSLSGKLFLQRSRLAFSKQLSDQLEFRFTSFQQRDLDADQSHMILELIRNFRSTLAVSIYGEPSFYKRENDFGLALLYRPTPSQVNHSKVHEIRIFHTWVDLTRADHNDRPDYFVPGHEPRTMGLVGRCRGCGFASREEGVTQAGQTIETDSRMDHSWLEYYTRWEAPTRWIFPQTLRVYEHEALSAGVNLRVAPPRLAGVSVNTRMSLSRKRESQTPDGTSSTIVDSSLERNLAQVLISLEGPATLWNQRRISIEGGLGWFERSWQRSDGQSLKHQNLLPFIWARAPGFNNRDLVEVGYDITFFSATFVGSSSEQSMLASRSSSASSDVVSDHHLNPLALANLATTELKSWAAEHRLNLRYTLGFDDEASLSLALTADPDAAIRESRGIFEGGNAQFRVIF